MFTQEQLKSVLNKFLDRGCKGISRQDLALELECGCDDIAKNEKIVKDTLIEVQEDRAIENCKLILKKLLAKGIKLTPEGLADYLKISEKYIRNKQYIFEQAVAELREAQTVP